MKTFATLVILFASCAFFQNSAHAETETLEEALSSAYQSNPSLQAERAGLRATDEQVSQAQSHWRPNIQATGNVGKTYQYTPSQAAFGDAHFADTTRGYGVQVTQPIWRGGRTDAETDVADKTVLSGRAKLYDAEQQLFLDTSTAFLGVIRDEATLDIQHQNEHVLEEKLYETQVRARVGDLTQTDISQAESRLARARVNRYQAENTLINDRASYMRLVGHMPEKLKPPALPFDKARRREDILQLADTKNPKVISAQYDMDAANAEIRLNKGALLPELDLVGSSGRNYGESSTLPGRFDSNQVLVQLTIPLYDSGVDYSKTREAEQTATQKRMVLEEVRHKARETADNAWEAFQEAQASISADTAEVDAATRALTGVKIQNKAGTRTTLDVLNAEQELLDAKIDLLKSQYQRDISIIQITAAIGQLTIDYLSLPVQHYDPTRHYNDVRNKWVGFSKDDTDYSVPPSIDHDAEQIIPTTNADDIAPSPIKDEVTPVVSTEMDRASP